MVLDLKSVKKQFQTMSLRYYNHSRINPKNGLFKLDGRPSLTPANLLALANNISNRDREFHLEELFGKDGIRELKERLEYLAILEEPFEKEYSTKVYCNVGHVLCDLLKMGTYPQCYYDRLNSLMLETCPDAVSLRQVKKNDYNPRFAIAIASEGSDLDAVIEILFGDQTLQVSTILIQEALKEKLKIKLSSKCATFLEHGYTTGLEAETLAVANEAKKMGAKVGEFKSSSDIMAFVYDLLPLKSFTKGNVLFIVPFRTASEAVKLAANVNFIAASVWGDRSTALSIAHALKCNNVWINCHGLTHPGVPLYPKSDGILPVPVALGLSKLLGLKEMEEHYRLICRWMRIPYASLPNTRQVVYQRHLGPVGSVIVPWRAGCLNWIIPALACGNKIGILVQDSEKSRDLIELLLETFPAMVSECRQNPPKLDWVIVNRREIPYREQPSDQTLLTNFINTKFIWFAEPQSL